MDQDPPKTRRELRKTPKEKRGERIGQKCVRKYEQIMKKKSK